MVTVEYRFSPPPRSKRKTRAVGFELDGEPRLFVEENGAIVGDYVLFHNTPGGITRNYYCSCSTACTVFFFYYFQEIFLTAEYGIFILRETFRTFGEIARGGCFMRVLSGPSGKVTDCRLSVCIILSFFFFFLCICPVIPLWPSKQRFG